MTSPPREGEPAGTKKASWERNWSSLSLSREKRREKIKVIWRCEPVRPKHMLELIQHLNVSDLNLTVGSFCFACLTKKKKDFGWDMMNA